MGTAQPTRVQDIIDARMSRFTVRVFATGMLSMKDGLRVQFDIVCRKPAVSV